MLVGFLMMKASQFNAICSEIHSPLAGYFHQSQHVSTDRRGVDRCLLSIFQLFCARTVTYGQDCCFIPVPHCSMSTIENLQHLMQLLPRILLARKALLSPGGLFIFCSLRGGLLERGDLLIIQGEKCYKNALMHFSAFFLWKICANSYESSH